MTTMFRPLAATPPSRARELVSRLFFPDAWIMNDPYNPRLDHYLRTSLNLGMVEGFRDPFLKVGGHSLWVRNYPYAYGTLYPEAHCAPDANLSGRPSFVVIRRLRKIEKQLRPPKAAPYPTL
jgi:hypothetical protein